MAIVTQFFFDMPRFLSWVRRVRAIGVTLPIHVGVAGPTKLQTLIKYGLACGIGPSLGILKKRAADITNLLRPFEPTSLLTELASYQEAYAELGVEKVHFFPLGDAQACADWIAQKRGQF